MDASRGHSIVGFIGLLAVIVGMMLAGLAIYGTW
jgi:hypothetical protein